MNEREIAEKFDHVEEMLSLLGRDRKKDNIDDMIWAMADRLIPVYTKEQLEWLEKDNDSFEYCDQVLSEFDFTSLTGVITMAMGLQLRDQLEEEWRDFKEELKEEGLEY
jgi:hypothetical protein